MTPLEPETEQNELQAYEYRQRPFGKIFDQLRLDESDLWEEAAQTARNHSQLFKQYVDLLIQERSQTGVDGEEAEARREKIKSLEQIVDESNATRQTLFTKIFKDKIAPEMQKEGFDPIEACI